ncbi:MAG: DNA primase [Bacteroidales bacterium]|nr:DNA primase [Bacteroidales bacterium]
MIPQSTIDEIKLAARIEDVVGDFIPLKKKGTSWVCNCPFHDDHSPSMYVNPRLGIYKCFVCDASGYPIKFLMEYAKMSYVEALHYLADKYHIDIQEEKQEKTAEQLAAESEHEALLNVNAYAEKYFIDQMFNTETGQTVALNYLKERGFKDATIKKFKLGYCPDGWDTFLNDAVKNGYKLDYLLRTGLVKKSESSGKLFDFYRGRVMFPIWDKAGRTIGFGGRTLEKKPKMGKYLNPPDSEVYHKSEVLYGFYLARPTMRKEQNVYLVEGYTDVISMFEAGIENVVAACGTALTDGQVKLIKSQTPSVTILRDGDKAGLSAAMRDVNILLQGGVDVRVIVLPDGEDPDSFAKNHRDSEIQEFFQQNAVSIVEFKARVMLPAVGNDPLKRAQVVQDVIQTISYVPDEIKQSFYIKEASERFGIPEEKLDVDLRRLKYDGLMRKERTSALNNPSAQPQVYTPDLHLPSPQQQPLPVNQQEYVEMDVVRLILKYGTLEAQVQTIGEDGQSAVVPMRVDQYVFNEFASEGIGFETPLFQRFYEEYARLAVKYSDKDDLQRAFAQHDDQEIQKLSIDILSEEDPEPSPTWLQRFDLYTPSIATSYTSLNLALSGCINFFKLRLMEKQKQLLIDELAQEHPQEVQNQILQRLGEVNARCKELAEIQRIVIPNQN